MKNKSILIITIASILFSCNTETTLETIDELTVNAYLHAGEYMDTVSFGKVIPLDSTDALAAPEGLNPVVIAESGDIFPLTYTGINGLYINEELFIVEGETYTLEVEYNDKTITAEAYIPAKPQGLSLSDTLIYRTKIEGFPGMPGGQDIPDPIELTWQGEEGGFYFVHVKNIENDPEPVNEFFANNDRPAPPNFRTEPSANPFYAIDTFRDITYFGTYEVTVYKVNPEYIALYEDNTSGAGSLNEIRTNVQNGFGIFTGINSEKVYFEVKQQ
ncbi:MAG: DUF4249 family protein [Bacteroidetes bacterium]|nr:DUF4249 family protein [Bacteroidota bacterium]